MNVLRDAARLLCVIDEEYRRGRTLKVFFFSSTFFSLRASK